MRAVTTVAGALVVLAVLIDAFETVILPRGINRSIRLTRLVYAITWLPYRALARMVRRENWRDSMLAYAGPSANLALLVVWAMGMILGFALIHWGLGSHVAQASHGRTFGDDVYFSGTTLFTLGLGDVAPVSGWERAITVIEAGLGLGFLAIVISYLPVLYQTFSHREILVNRLDVLAGAPPTPGVILRRYTNYGLEATRSLLEDWQHWTAELMDATQAYPVLAYYRSQHHHQSWLAALVAILDTCALLLTDPSETFSANRDSAELAFALASHAARDVAVVLKADVEQALQERPAGTHHDHLLAWLRHRGHSEDQVKTAEEALTNLRLRYESHVAAVADELLVELPAFCPECSPVQHEH